MIALTSLVALSVVLDIFESVMDCSGHTEVIPVMHREALIDGARETAVQMVVDRCGHDQVGEALRQSETAADAARSLRVLINAGMEESKPFKMGEPLPPLALGKIRAVANVTHPDPLAAAILMDVVNIVADNMQRESSVLKPNAQKLVQMWGMAVRVSCAPASDALRQ